MCVCVCIYVCAKLLQSYLTLCDPMAGSQSGSSVHGVLPMENRAEYWSGLPHPPPGDLPEPGIEPRSLMFPVLAGRFFITKST